MTYHLLCPSLARRYGVHAALVVKHIWDEVCANERAGRCSFAGRTWMRSSQMMFTAIMPYLTKNMVRRALERLMKRGVIVRGEFGDSPFDRTSWYGFTQFGALMMRESEDEKDER